MLTEIEQSERRVGTRIPSNLPVYFCDTAGWDPLRLESIQNRSSGGLNIQTASPIAVGMRIDIEFLPTPENGQEEILLSKGEVRYVRKHGPDQYILGVKTLYNTKLTKVHAKNTARIPKIFALPPIRVKAAPPKSVQQKKTAQKTEPSKSHTERKKYPVWKPVLFVILFLVLLLLLLLSSRQSLANRTITPGGNSYTHRVDAGLEEVSASYEYTYGAILYNRLDTSDDLEKTDSILPNLQTHRETFLFASLASLQPDIPFKGNREVSSPSKNRPDAGKPSPVEQLARNLEKAQSSARTGNRTAALYLTRNAVDTIGDLPEPWRDVLRQFRARLISHPEEIPPLPKLDNWVTLSSSLTSIPVDAPIGLYVDKDAFVMHVVKNGQTIWQFPIGLGAKDSTPEGIFTIGSKITNPDWYNDGNPVPAGSADNPLGDRWLGLSDGNTPLTYGMHPTDKSQSIGQALSKGCIRMRPKDARRLYNMIPIGTPIVIRSGGRSPKL